jgi:hypothetical protein
MVVGVLQMRLIIRDSRSLKDRRRVVLSLKDQIRHRFNVSVAEISDDTGTGLDTRKQALVGVAMATNDAAHADEVLAGVVQAARRIAAGLGAELVGYETETF